MRKGCIDPDTFSPEELKALERWHFAKLRGTPEISTAIPEESKEKEFKLHYRRVKLNLSAPTSAATIEPEPANPKP